MTSLSQRISIKYKECRNIGWYIKGASYFFLYKQINEYLLFYEYFINVEYMKLLQVEDLCLSFLFFFFNQVIE